MSSSHPPDRRRPQSPVSRRIEDRQQRLIDLTRRNRLLYFKPSKSAGLTVAAPGAAPYGVQALVRDYYPAGEFHEPQCRGGQCRLLAELAAGEGPTHLKPADSLPAETAGLFGVARVSGRIRERLPTRLEESTHGGWLSRAGWMVSSNSR